MATRGRPIEVALIRYLQALRLANSVRATARAAGVSRNTVRKYCDRGRPGKSV